MSYLGNKKKIKPATKKTTPPIVRIKPFEQIIESDHDSIVAWMAFPSNPDNNYGWPVRIGILNYFVPVRYLAEYLELPKLEGNDVQKKFLENVKKECTVLGRYMHAIK